MGYKKILCAATVYIILICSCNTGNNNKNPAPPKISAEEQLKQAITKHPDSLELIQNLIELYRNNGDYDSAINLTNNLIKKDSDNVQLWDIKGTLLYENGDTLKAINAYETAINMYPLPEYIMALGTMYAQTKNPKALEMADALLIADKAKGQKKAWFIKGLYYSYTSDKKKAISFFDSCINKDYTYMFAYREKAIALYDLGRYEDALKVLTRATTIQNNFDEGYYWMGRCYEKLFMNQQAIESYHTALLYDKDFIEAKEALARLENKQK